MRSSKSSRRSAIILDSTVYAIRRFIATCQNARSPVSKININIYVLKGAGDAAAIVLCNIAPRRYLTRADGGERIGRWCGRRAVVKPEQRDTEGSKGWDRTRLTRLPNGFRSE